MSPFMLETRQYLSMLYFLKLVKDINFARHYVYAGFTHMMGVIVSKCQSHSFEDNLIQNISRKQCCCTCSRMLETCFRGIAQLPKKLER